MKLETLSPELQQYEPLLARMQEQMESELVRRTSENRIDSYYPDEGPLRRELYPKHLEFFRAGVEHRERCFLAANRVGKTEGVGGFELTCHLTGEYPVWWEGRTFDHQIEAWAAGDTSQTVRDIIQAKLLSDGRLFVFSSLQNWLSEFRIYRRDEKGKIVKQNDHLMDATRYLILSGLQVACREPREEEEDNRQWIDGTRNEYTGY